MGAQISSRQAIQKRLKFLSCRGGKRTEMVQDFVVSVTMDAFIYAAVKKIGRADVELPEILRFPGCERFRVHSFDVRIREQAKHFQQFRAADAFGKLRHGARVKNVTPQPRSQILMMLNEKEHRFPVGRRKLQAFEALFRYLQAGRNMIEERDGLAGVMQQDREVEQLGLVQFTEDAGVAFVPFELGLPQAV